MHVTQPPDFIKIEESDFTEFLLTCPDYHRAAFANGVIYRWTYNQHCFAVIMGHGKTTQIYGDPKEFQK